MNQITFFVAVASVTITTAMNVAFTLMPSTMVHLMKNLVMVL